MVRIGIAGIGFMGMNHEREESASLLRDFLRKTRHN
jgi:hypothetical protein